MKSFLNSIIALFIVVNFSSCLKDKQLIGPDADGAVANVIEFGNIVPPSSGVTSKYPLYVYSLELNPSVQLEIPIKVVGVYNPSKDITVSVEIDNSILATYNSTQKGKYVALPTQNYAVKSYDVVIPKGTKSGTLAITLKGNEFDFNATYALALRIKSISEGVISGNFGSIIVATVPKNPYDGIYSVEDGFVQRYSAPGVPTIGDGLNGSMKGNPNVTMSSIDATTVEVTNLRWAGGTSGIGGIDNLRFTVNPADNSVTVTALGNATAANIPGAVNKYDPETKTFTVNFWWNPTSTTREVTNLVLKYNSAR